MKQNPNKQKITKAEEYKKYILWLSEDCLPVPELELLNYKIDSNPYFNVMPQEMFISFFLARQKIENIKFDTVLKIHGLIRRVVKEILDKEKADSKGSSKYSIRPKTSDFIQLQQWVISEKIRNPKLSIGRLVNDLTVKNCHLFYVFSIIKFHQYLNVYRMAVLKDKTAVSAASTLTYIYENELEGDTMMPASVASHLAQISSLVVGSFQFAQTGNMVESGLRDYKKLAINRQKLKKNLLDLVISTCEKKLIVSETGRAAVLEGKWKPREQHFETLKPLIDKYGNSGLRHHKIAEKLSSEKKPNGTPITQYRTSGGLAQNMTTKELKGLIKSYFKDTDRAHLIHGMK